MYGQPMVNSWLNYALKPWFSYGSMAVNNHLMIVDLCESMVIGMGDGQLMVLTLRMIG